MTYAKIVNGRLKEATELKPEDMTGYVEVNLPLLGLRYDGEKFYSVPYVDPVYVEPEVVVPHVISMRQARLALLNAGLLATVDNAVANGTDEAMKIEWEYATEVRRDWTSLIAMATSIGLSDTDLDNLFIQGAAL